MKKLKPGKDNKEDRMNFVKYWAEYVRTHDDEDWSKQQKVLIDSQIKNARSIRLTKEQVEHIRANEKPAKKKIKDDFKDILKFNEQALKSVWDNEADDQEDKK